MVTMVVTMIYGNHTMVTMVDTLIYVNHGGYCGNHGRYFDIW